jgi:hypothetical protein
LIIELALSLVPAIGCGGWLATVHFAHVLHIEPEKVNDFAGRIDFSLENGLLLTGHHCSIYPGPVRTRDEVGSS